MKDGIELIADERKRQMDVEGYSADHDDKQTKGQIASAAACYAMLESDRNLQANGWGSFLNVIWPRNWERKFWKPTPDNRIKELTKSGALIAAEIDRLQRKKGGIK